VLIVMQMAKVSVDKSKCIGCGACVAVAEEVFEIGSDGKSRVKVAEVSGKLEKKAREAAEVCPAGAITVK